MSDAIFVNESTSAATPAAGYAGIRVKSNRLKLTTDAGAEIDQAVTGDLVTASGTLANTDRLIGRDTAGAGAAEEVSVGGGIEFTGTGAVQTSAFTGDVTKTAGGTALTIAPDAVTYAKMQNVSATDMVLGRSTAGAGDVEEIPCTANGRAILAASTDANVAAALGAVAASAKHAFRGDGTWSPPMTGAIALAIPTGDYVPLAYPSGAVGNAGAGLTQTADVSTYFPFVLSHRTTIDNLGCATLAANPAGLNAKYAIYSSDGTNGLPGTRVCSTAAVALSTGAGMVMGSVSSTILEPDVVYWAYQICDGAAVLQSLATGQLSIGIASTGGVPYRTLSVAESYAAGPAATSSAALTDRVTTLNINTIARVG